MCERRSAEFDELNATLLRRGGGRYPSLMPRTPCIYVGGHVYHVLNRANARAALFDDEADYRRFTDPLAEERARAGMPVLSWCLMPNHRHLVLWPRDDSDLGLFVRRPWGCSGPPREEGQSECVLSF